MRKPLAFFSQFPFINGIELRSISFSPLERVACETTSGLCYRWLVLLPNRSIGSASKVNSNEPDWRKSWWWWCQINSSASTKCDSNDNYQLEPKTRPKIRRQKHQSLIQARADLFARKGPKLKSHHNPSHEISLNWIVAQWYVAACHCFPGVC